jgi:hypothetical protein
VIDSDAGTIETEVSRAQQATNESSDPCAIRVNESTSFAPAGNSIQVDEPVEVFTHPVVPEHE